MATEQTYESAEQSSQVKPGPKRTASARQVYREAREAGERAARNTTPTPMVVSEADGISDRPDPNGRSWYVPSGVCGFAWINVRGNTWFVRQMKKIGLASDDRNSFSSAPFQKDGYYGGYTHWATRIGGQSMEIKIAYARAFASVLEAYGITARVMSRMD